MKENIANIAKNLEIGMSTLYQWKKTRPKLYKFLINNSEIQKYEIIEYFNKLTEKEKELYISEIKARVIRKELDKK